jgi:carbon-monoxide dehydrogenase large subunit
MGKFPHSLKAPDSAAAKDLTGGRTINIGKSLLRREDANLITGAGTFVDDIRPSTVTYARFVRSSMAHARILRIDTSVARRSVGVVAVLTATDLNLPPLEAPLDNSAARRLPRPMLAHNVVRFAGEPVAHVIAQTPRLAEEALLQLNIDIE